MEHIGKEAIVIGASMGGLLVARALADYYDTVTILERDALPKTQDAQRRSTRTPCSRSSRTRARGAGAAFSWVERGSCRSRGNLRRRRRRSSLVQLRRLSPQRAKLFEGTPDQ